MRLFEVIQNLFEYKREVTLRSFGKGLWTQALSGRERLPDSLKDTNSKWDLDKVANYVISQLEEGDPTSNKIFTPWLAREYAKKNIQRLEDVGSTYKPKLHFYSIYKKNRDFPATAKDIMKLNAAQFYDIMQKYAPPEPELTNKGISTEVYKDADVRVIVPKDREAACYYGQGTRWCTAATKGTNHFDLYNQDGELYIMIPTKPKYAGEKYQLHVGSGQFMDLDDLPVGNPTAFLSRWPSAFAAIGKIEPTMKDLIIFSADERIKNAKEAVLDEARSFIDGKYQEYQEEHDGMSSRIGYNSLLATKMRKALADIEIVFDDLENITLNMIKESAKEGYASHIQGISSYMAEEVANSGKWTINSAPEVGEMLNYIKQFRLVGI